MKIGQMSTIGLTKNKNCNIRYNDSTLKQQHVQANRPYFAPTPWVQSHTLLQPI
jgi:hypothetical protein